MKKPLRPKGAALLPISAKMTETKPIADVLCQRAMSKKRATTKIFHLQVQTVLLPAMMRMSVTLTTALLVQPSNRALVVLSGAMLKSWRCILDIDFCFIAPNIYLSVLASLRYLDPALHWHQNQKAVGTHAGWVWSWAQRRCSC